MRGRLRTGIAATAAITAAVALYVLLTLPSRTLILDVTRPPTHVMGVVHVHSNRSDGTGSVEEIAAAASRAGVSYVVLTDHGDGTRQPDSPRYVDGVLMIDAVEINTRDGHIVALGLKDAAPYPLAGPARDVLEDLHRQGAVGIAAHPDSPKESLRWRANNLPFDGIEWLNADSEWRDESPTRIFGGVLRALVRPAESIADLFARPVASLRRWDQAARTRPVFGIAGLDAHARIGWREQDEPRQRTALARPTYESMFRTLADVVVLDKQLSGDAQQDAASVLAALKAGKSYSVVRAFADPGSLTFNADVDGVRLESGGRSDAVAVTGTFNAVVEGADSARVTLFRNGQPIQVGQGRVVVALSDSGVYRVEVNLPGRDMPWIVSNPITLGPPVAGFGGRGGGPPQLQTGPAGATETRLIAAADPRWTTERDPLSTAATVLDGTSRALDFTLGAGAAYGQFSALVIAGDSDAGIEEVTFTGTASRPMRVSVQVRLPGGKDGQRWQRSVYLDPTPREVALRLQDFEPVGQATTRRPIVAPIHALLFVVDTVNTKPATSGRFSISDLTLHVNRLETN